MTWYENKHDKGLEVDLCLGQAKIVIVIKVWTVMPLGITSSENDA